MLTTENLLKMPELAEVKIVAEGLHSRFGGHKLLKATVIGGKFSKQPDLFDQLAPHYPLTLDCVQNKGKFLYWCLDNNLYAFCSLAMTGSFGAQTKHSALRFEFDNGDIHFNDIRHFGSFKIVKGKEELDNKLNSLGWDCLLKPAIPEWLLPKLRKKNHKTIVEVMLDQSIFCGCGNYLRAEILYRSSINPFRLVK